MGCRQTRNFGRNPVGHLLERLVSGGQRFAILFREAKSRGRIAMHNGKATCGVHSPKLAEQLGNTLDESVNPAYMDAAPLKGQAIMPSSALYPVP